MKTNKLTILACFLIAGFMFLQSCEKKLEELSEGTLVEIDTDLLYTPGMVRFVDASDGSTLSNVNVSFSGDEVNMLYSTSGKATLAPVDGFMDIGIDKAVQISEASPFRFNITASAAGYLTTQYSVVLTDVESRLWTIALVKLDNAPDGVTVSNHAITADGNGVTESTIFSADEGTPLAPRIGIAEGTQLLNANGTAVAGQATLQTVYFTPTAENVDDYMVNSNLVQMADGSYETGYLGHVAYFDFSMKVGNQAITSFSEPLIAEIKLPEGTLNPVTGEPYVIGDQINAWSYDEDTGIWLFEATHTIESVSGGFLSINMDIPHFSIWSLAPSFTVPTSIGPAFVVGSPYNLTINSPIPSDLEDDLTLDYYSEMEYKWYFGSGTYRNWKSQTHTFKNGQVINVPLYVSPYFQTRIVVYSGKQGCKREAIATSQWFRPIDNPTVNLSGLFQPDSSISGDYQFIVRALCDNVTVKPTGYILMRLAGSGCPYQLEGTMINGSFAFHPKAQNLYTDNPTLDTEYDWKIIWNGESEELLNQSTRAIIVNALTGAINPDTGRNYTEEEINNFIENPFGGGFSFLDFDLTQAQCDDLTGG